MIADGLDYVFVHGTVQEFLAARYLAHHLNDDQVVEASAIGRTDGNDQFLTDNHETLPIACGHSMEHTARLFQKMKKYFGGSARQRLLFRCLSEAESMEHRMLRDQLTVPLRELEIAKLLPKVKARFWAYELLAKNLISANSARAAQWSQWLPEEVKFSRDIFPSEHFNAWWLGKTDLHLSSQSEELLTLMLSDDVLGAQRFNRRREEEYDRMEKLVSARGVDIRPATSGNFTPKLMLLRNLDLPGDPEDRDFARLQRLSGPELAGLLGSPNFRQGAGVSSVAYAPDGRMAASGGQDGVVRLWDLESGRQIRSFAGHSSSVRACAFAPGGKRILSGSSDNTLKLWDAYSGKCLRTWDLAFPAYCVSWQSAPPGLWEERKHAVLTQAVAVGLSNGTVLMFDLTDV